jgi:hypothetical protein
MADSKDRDVNLYPNGNDYYVHLATPIKNVSRVDLVSARVPNTMYNFTNISGEENILIDGNSVYLPDGFYTAQGLADAITAGSTYQPVTVDYLPNEGHFIFSTDVSISIVIVSQQLANMLGLIQGDPGYTTTLADSNYPAYAGKYVLISEKIINLSVNDYIYLDITEFRTPSRVATGAITGTTGTITGSNAGRAFAPIIIDVSSACVKNFHEAKDYNISVYFPQPIGKLSRLHVKWYDKDGQLLNFRGLDTNAFVLRVYSIDEVPPPPPPKIEEVELKRLIDVTETFPIPKPQKRRKIPWVLIVLILLGSLFAYKTFFKPAISE